VIERMRNRLRSSAPRPGAPDDFRTASDWPVLDPDFAADVEEIIRNRKPRRLPLWILS